MIRRSCFGLLEVVMTPTLAPDVQVRGKPPPGTKRREGIHLALDGALLARESLVGRVEGCREHRGRLPRLAQGGQERRDHGAAEPRIEQLTDGPHDALVAGTV